MRPNPYPHRALPSANAAAAAARATAAGRAMRIGLAVLVVGTALALAACSSDEPATETSTSTGSDSGLVWSNNFDDSTDDVRFKDEEFPKLADVPSQRPTAPTAEQIDEMANGLVADHENARHSSGY